MKLAVFQALNFKYTWCDTTSLLAAVLLFYCVPAIRWERSNFLDLKNESGLWTLGFFFNQELLNSYISRVPVKSHVCILPKACFWQLVALYRVSKVEVPTCPLYWSTILCIEIVRISPINHNCMSNSLVCYCIMYNLSCLLKARILVILCIYS